MGPADEAATNRIDINARFAAVGHSFNQHTLALTDTLSALGESARGLDESPIEARIPVDLVRAVGRDKAIAITTSIKESLDQRLTSGEASERITSRFRVDPAALEFVMHVVETLGRRPREPIFNSAMLTSAVAALEAHFGRLAEVYFEAAPEALHAVPREELQEFSLRDLQGMSSLADAIDVAIGRRVDRIANSGLAGWRKFFLDRLKIDLYDMEGGQDLREIFERRHCVVHNGGRVSARYISNAGSGVLGQTLRVDSEYVRQATETLGLVGMQLLGLQWVKFGNDTQRPSSFFERHGLEALRKKHFNYALHLFTMTMTWAKTDSARLVTQVNL